MGISCGTEEINNVEFKSIKYKSKQNYLSSIKSAYNLKEVFSFLNEKKN